jgi:hypothetical protein
MRRRGRKVLGLFILTAATLLSPRMAHAQTIRGSVVLPDSTTAVSGVIVLATDARGTTVGRTLTNQRGQFALTMPAAGAYTVKVLRIGYRPTVAPTVTVAASETATLRLVFAADAVVLTGMNVRDRETCRVNADTGLAVARVWEEARKAMLTSQLTAEGAPLFAEWVEYDRMLDSTGRLIRQQQVRSSKYPTTHAFRSAPAAVLASEGYVTADNTGTTFYAPDAEVLLSDAFVSGHCFRLVAPERAADNLIGVAFQPSRDRRDKREIEGTLWLDRSSAELRTLEFRYTNLPELVSVADPGGRVEFVRLADGNWLVSRWSLRMPKVGARERSSEGGQRKTLMAASNLVVRNVQVTGGEVSRVTRHDSLVFAATGPAVAVQLVAEDTMMPKGGATLTLEGTDYRAVADAGGAFRLTPVLAGRYRARVSTLLMDSLNIPAVVKEIDTHADARVDTLTLPTGWEIVSRTCPRDSVTRGEGMLHGRVLDERARPLGQAAVTVSWKGDFKIVSSGTTGNGVGYNEKTLGAMSDDAGQWRVCGVPTETPITVRVLTDSLSDVRTTRVPEHQPFAAIDLVARRIAQATRDLETAKAQIVLPRALVELMVMDPNGNVLPDATLEVVTSSGASRTVVTGPSGRALMPDVAPGRLTLRAKRIGFTPGQVVATVEAGRNTVPIVLSQVAAPMLDTVRVIGGRRTTSRLDEFETRRLNHVTAASFTREDILKRNPTETWQVLASVPSMRISDRDNMVVAVSTRNMMSNFGGQPCYMRVMVDGMERTREGGATFDLRQLPKPEEIHGIEVFAGPATIPLQYGGIGDPTKWCGLIAIWTR